MEATIAELFARQARDCRDLGSPFTGRILDKLLDLTDPTSPLGLKLAQTGPRPEDALPLRLTGALHALARTGDPDLAPVYPPNDPTDAALTAALSRALSREQARILPWLDRPPQTNEVARSAVLIATGHWLTRRFGLPLMLSELGASAGLNLLWDNYSLVLPDRTLGPANPALTLTPDWQGQPPVQAAPRILTRAGVDLSPLHPVTDRDRLLAYVWPDQPLRLARCAAALDLAAGLRPTVDQADAATWARARLMEPRPPSVHLIYHTIAAKYFSAETARRLGQVLAIAGQAATPDRPLAHLSMEHDGPTPGAALTMTLWPGGETHVLGRADFHGRWVTWQPPAP